ncbi:hypothetical protein IV203_003872 [Nitzschia inconspicua]|uniref:Uncharacterized protein n=1 Tax=Nitzschia inconspicua TaxID=303405 RepID=A0A9K3L4A2_9STRA|nr:hypothetical protein IV203_003872 [Nitzschia inconspicua]
MWTIAAFPALFLEDHAISDTHWSSKEIGFECCASADGTHGVSQTDYRLIPFGVFFHNSKGNRQFFPIAYAFGEGEREVVILILLLNIKSIARDLFGVSNLQFVGGIVSDHSAAFLNSFKEVFTLLHSNATSISSGSLKILKQSAPQMFLKYWELTKESWVSKGEAKLAETFEGAYINNPDYNRWYYTSSGMHGCVPDNNPLESHNRVTKGTSDVRGLIIINRSMENALQVEFPRMIDTLSREKIIPNTDFHPTLDISLAFSNNKFSEITGGVFGRWYKYTIRWWVAGQRYRVLGGTHYTTVNLLLREVPWCIPWSVHPTTGVSNQHE